MAYSQVVRRPGKNSRQDRRLLRGDGGTYIQHACFIQKRGDSDRHIACHGTDYLSHHALVDQFVRLAGRPQLLFVVFYMAPIFPAGLTAAAVDCSCQLDCV